MSEDSDLTCPLCLEELDLTDQQFHPCPCGYQICMYCYNHLLLEPNPRCPACRQAYDPNFQYAPANADELIKRERAQGRKDQKKRPEINRKQLSNVRVIQRSLVYVTNLSLSVAKEEILKRPEYFGQYGKIIKIVVNKNNVYGANSSRPSVSAYVTYARDEDSLACIQAVEGAWLDGKMLRASFGTTKYCTYFLRKETCKNPDCLYLHELGEEVDSFTKEDMTTSRKQNFHEAVQKGLQEDNKRTLPGELLKAWKGKGLPPPGYVSKRTDGVPEPVTEKQQLRQSQPGRIMASREREESGLPPTSFWANPETRDHLSKSMDIPTHAIKGDDDYDEEEDEPEPQASPAHAAAPYLDLAPVNSISLGEPPSPKSSPSSPASFSQPSPNWSPATPPPGLFLPSEDPGPAAPYPGPAPGDPFESWGSGLVNSLLDDEERPPEPSPSHSSPPASPSVLSSPRGRSRFEFANDGDDETVQQQSTFQALLPGVQIHFDQQRSSPAGNTGQHEIKPVPLPSWPFNGFFGASWSPLPSGPDQPRGEHNFQDPAILGAGAAYNLQPQPMPAGAQWGPPPGLMYRYPPGFAPPMHQSQASAPSQGQAPPAGSLPAGANYGQYQQYQLPPGLNVRPPGLNPYGSFDYSFHSQPQTTLTQPNGFS